MRKRKLSSGYIGINDNKKLIESGDKKGDNSRREDRVSNLNDSHREICGSATAPISAISSHERR